MAIFVKRLTPDAVVPTRAHEWDAGLDLFCLEGFGVMPFSSKLVSTGIAVDIRPGQVGLIRARSGLSVKHNIEVGAGVIDCGYVGEIKVHLYNHGDSVVTFNPYEKIAQLLVLPCVTECVQVVEGELPEWTTRGVNGFGSTSA